MTRLRSLAPLAALALIAAMAYGAMRFVPRLAVEYREAADFHPVWGYVYLAVTAAAGLSLLALALGVLRALLKNTRFKRERRVAEARRPSEMTVAEREQEIRAQVDEARAIADDESVSSAARKALAEDLEDLTAKQSAQTLEIVACGTISSGKSSLLNALAGRDVFRTDAQGGTTVQRNEVPWPGQDRVLLVDSPGLAEVGAAERESLARLTARDADVVLFVVDGPMRDFEYDLLTRLAALDKRIIVCLNKDDWFRPADRDLLRGQLCQQVAKFVPAENVLVTRARASQRVRVRVAPDGTEFDERIEVDPDLNALAERLLAIVQRDGRDLLLANLLLRSRGLAAAARAAAQGELDRRAQQIVDRATWQSGAAAALSPMPLVDLAASLALSTKMVLDLARVYRQAMTLETAGELLAQLGKVLVSVTGTSLMAPLLGTAVATVLKTAPGVGTLAGGVVQGLTQALVTRWIGRIFIVYFRNESQEPPAGWAGLAREEWNALTRPAELAEFVRSGVKRLGKGTS